MTMKLRDAQPLFMSLVFVFAIFLVIAFNGWRTEEQRAEVAEARADSLEWTLGVERWCCEHNATWPRDMKGDSIVWRRKP